MTSEGYFVYNKKVVDDVIYTWLGDCDIHVEPSTDIELTDLKNIYKSYAVTGNTDCVNVFIPASSLLTSNLEDIKTITETQNVLGYSYTELLSNYVYTRLYGCNKAKVTYSVFIKERR